jgi:hypothetical protein
MITRPHGTPRSVLQTCRFGQLTVVEFARDNYAIMRLSGPGVAEPSAEKATETVRDATGDGSDGKKSAAEEPGHEAIGGPR